MKQSGLQSARQSTRKKMKKSLGPDFVDPSDLGLHGKETSSDVRCDICHEGLPLNSKKDCITCRKCAIRAHATCVRTQLNCKYIKTMWLCVNCRHCYECDKSDVDQNELLFCRSCDLSYHYDCVEGDEIITGAKWVCYRCKKPSVPVTRAAPVQRQSSATASTSTPVTSATSSTTTTVASSASNISSSSGSTSSRGGARNPEKTNQPEVKPPNSTSSSSATPTPSTSRSSYNFKNGIIIEGARLLLRKNEDTSKIRPIVLYRKPRQPILAPALDALTPTTVGRVVRNFNPIPHFTQRRVHYGQAPQNSSNSNSNSKLNDRSERSANPIEPRRSSQSLNVDQMRQRHMLNEPRSTSSTDPKRSLKVNPVTSNDSKNIIDLPDVDMKDSFTEKPLTLDPATEKLLGKPRSLKQPDDPGIFERLKMVEKILEQHSTSNDKSRRISTESSTENSRRPINTATKPSNLGSYMRDLMMNVDEDAKTSPSSSRQPPQRPRLPEKRKVNEIQGSGFVLSKPAELTAETAKLLKDSNGAKRLKLVLFERACKAESLLPAETSIWTTEDVYNFIRFIGFPDAADNFLDHQIDGKSLLLLSRRDVLTGFKLKLGPALKIYAHIFRLQRKRPALLLED